MSDPGLPPAIPTEFQIYNSYAVDPLYQLYFTYAWLGAIGLGVLIEAPRVVSIIRQHGLEGVLSGWRRWIGGIQERMERSAKGEELDGARLLESQGDKAKSAEQTARSRERALSTSSQLPRFRIRVLSIIHRIMYPSLPLYLPRLTSKHSPAPAHPSSSSGEALSIPIRNLRLTLRKTYATVTIGQALVLAVYTAVVAICLFREAELGTNGNRAGFIALAQLTPIFLCSLPTSPLLYLIPPLPPSTRSHLLSSLSTSNGPPSTHPSHLTLNPLHRYLSRTLFLLATLHGALWIDQFRAFEEDDQLRTDKVKRGLVAWGFLAVVVLSSLGMVRRRWYAIFWVMHLLCIIGFFAAVSYHTPYSRPWIWPPIALFAWDLAVRALRLRIKEGAIEPLGGEDGEWTMLHIPDCDSGWRPTQHVNLRILHGSGNGLSSFGAHPFSITNGPIEASSASSGAPRGMTLYAKAVGGWTKGLHRAAKEGDYELASRNSFDDEAEDYELKEMSGEKDVSSPAEGTRVTVLIDGPYGGLELDLSAYADVLIIAGGSGITFAIGSVEECFAKLRDGRDEGSRRVRVRIVWMVKEMSSVEALAPALAFLHQQARFIPRFELDIDVHLTRTTSEDSAIGGLPVQLQHTRTYLIRSRPNIADVIKDATNRHDEAMDGETGSSGDVGGGLAVIACGARTLVQESGNAVAGLGSKVRLRCGGVDFHGEGYTT